MPDKSDDIYKYQPLWGKWFIDLPIGKGAFGSVYKISREDAGKKYTAAVKFISVPSDEQYREAEASLGNDEATLTGYFEDIVRNITNEIDMLYSMSGNTNIINYQDHEVVKKTDKLGWDILIRMEYVTSLKDYLREHAMSRGEIIRLGMDICSAIETCSKKGIIHRDIKDENIFVNEDGVFKLGDFGIARELSKSGRAASMRGTPLYMAPEVYRGEKYDAAVDIYSLGIVLYKLLNYGRMPLMPPHPQEIRYKDSEEALEKRMRGEPLPLPQAAGEKLGAIILKASAYNREERYNSATEMRKDLSGVLKELSEEELEEKVTLTVAKKADKVETGTTGPKQGTIGLVNLQTAGQAQGTPASGGGGENTVSETVDAPPAWNTPRQDVPGGGGAGGGMDYVRNAPVTKQNKSWLAWIPVIVVSGLVVILLVLAFALNIFGWLDTKAQTQPAAASATPTETATPSPSIKETVAFSDPILESEIRMALAKPTGDIYPEDMTRITTLTLDKKGVSNLSALQYCTNLQVLHAEKNSISDITALSQLTGLRDLVLDENQLTDITPLAGLTNLQKLWLGDNNISDISVLSNLTGITSLSLRGNKITNFTPLAPLVNVEELTMYKSNISDVSPLAGMTRMKKLWLTWNPVSNITPLMNMRELEVLYVSGCNTLRDISAISRMPNLKELNLSINQITDISPLAGCTKIVELNLQQNRISDLLPLSGMKGLKTLDISTNEISDLRPLSGLKKLTSLDLNTNYITSVYPLTGCTSLKSLDLRKNAYTIYDLYYVYGFVAEVKT